MRDKQSKLDSHLASSSSTRMKTTTTSVLPPARPSRSDSEGSEAMNAITLPQDHPSNEQSSGSSAQQRRRRLRAGADRVARGSGINGEGSTGAVTDVSLIEDQSPKRPQRTRNAAPTAGVPSQRHRQSPATIISPRHSKRLRPSSDTTPVDQIPKNERLTGRRSVRETSLIPTRMWVEVTPLTPGQRSLYSVTSPKVGGPSAVIQARGSSSSVSFDIASDEARRAVTSKVNRAPNLSEPSPKLPPSGLRGLSPQIDGMSTSRYPAAAGASGSRTGHGELNADKGKNSVRPDDLSSSSGTSSRSRPQLSNKLPIPPAQQHRNLEQLSLKSSASRNGRGSPHGLDAASAQKLSGSRKLQDKKSTPVNKAKRRHANVRDPDESEEDLLEELAIDEPDRFRSKTRLRQKKETPFQRQLRKLRDQRLGIVASSSDDESESESDSTSGTSDSLASQEFIVEDGGVVQEGLLPHQFSLNSAQTPEFKFKVVFHYFVLLVMKGPTVLPLRGENASYMLPQLEDQRRKMNDFKEGRVRSQIWRVELVDGLKSYPNYIVHYLEFPENHCDACNRRDRRSRFRIVLDGDEYDRRTYELLDNDSSDEDADDEATLQKEYLMGAHCRKLTELYHKIEHWEYELWHRVKGYYHDLLRGLYKPVPDDSLASSSESDPDSDQERVRLRRADRAVRRREADARVARLRGRQLPDDYKDVNSVMEWMDKMGYQNKDFKWIEGLIDESRRLEYDGTRDE